MNARLWVPALAVVAVLFAVVTWLAVTEVCGPGSTCERMWAMR